MIITVFIQARPDGGVRVWSDELPGLILSGRDRTKVIADIHPAAIALLKHKGVDVDHVTINAVFVSPAADDGVSLPQAQNESGP